MRRMRIFRLLVVCYLVSFILCHVSVYRMIIPEEAKQYAETLYALFWNPWGSIPQTLLFLLCMITMLTGALILLFHVRIGIYPFVIGSIAMRLVVLVGSNPDAYPVLQSTSSTQIYGMTCVLWGATVAIAIIDIKASSNHKINDSSFGDSTSALSR
jgi:hypothetical protein